MRPTEEFKKLISKDDIIRIMQGEILNLQRPAEEIILDDVDLCLLLKISKRHSANLRAKRMITYSKSGGRIYFRLSDVLAYLKRHEVKSIDSTNRFNK
jgi:hypothetical protein